MTNEQEKFLKRLKQHTEANSTNSSHQSFQFRVKQKGQWITETYSRESIQSLLNDQTILEFPNRWSPDQSVIIINKVKGQ